MIEQLFDHLQMLGNRKDIIGDLYRLRRQIAANPRDPEAADRLRDLEVLAAVAVAMGMSHNIVGKASNVARGRVDALLDGHRHEVTTVGDDLGYERGPTGVVARPQP